MDKTPVGKRLMLSAREHAYGERTVVSTGPEPTRVVATEGGKLMLSFDPRTASGGLLLRTSGAVRQTCPVGEKQVGVSNCGIASTHTDARALTHTFLGDSSDFKVLTQLVAFGSLGLALAYLARRLAVIQ